MLECSDEDLEVVRRLVAHDAPWDMLQALGFALFRTCAVPSIGEVLARTGEFTGRTHKRYEDTGLLLEAVLEHGPDSELGRAAVRRVNAVHLADDISSDDLRSVLATLVVVRVRWMQELGARPLTGHERDACTRYCRELGRRMGLSDLPRGYAGFERLLDDVERDRFAPTEGGRRVADATLGLLTTSPLHRHLPAAVVRTAALSLLDDPLLDALGHRRPPAVVRWAVRAGVRLRGRVARRLPRPPRPRWFRTQSVVRLHPGGYDVRELGTFPSGRPVPHGRSGART